VRRQKKVLGIRAKSQNAIEGDPANQIREQQISYLIDFDFESDAVGVEISYFLNVDQ
jgi:hypothetical protein